MSEFDKDIYVAIPYDVFILSTLPVDKGDSYYSDDLILGLQRTQWLEVLNSLLLAHAEIVFNTVYLEIELVVFKLRESQYKHRTSN